ncbi:hypothetical protein P154DRAFT_526513 [Amniculicola lignicola CBS 123094]|uniref:Uncharacterized protein n=1 Tax=Amniculicola lignicola CBS 123094 TaxID=1392246 RepID=A0A6A5W0I9_9PLEO|nr:hypothetical protein P154DRAFT_526513 [Amniculicola lignicola CBS 123094]
MSANLLQPIAIPATSTNLGSPFLRAYPPALEAYNIPVPTFLQFLDELNRAIVVSPPLQVLGLAGELVGIVPLATAQIVGTSISAAAQLGAYGVSKGRSEMFIKEANETLFAPRGLRVDIVKFEVVAKEADMPILDTRRRIIKDTVLLPPVSGVDVEVSAQQRRLVALAPWTSPLEVLPGEHREVPDSMFGRMHAATSERQRRGEEENILKTRPGERKDVEKVCRKEEKLGEELEKDMREFDRDQEKVRRKEEKDVEKMESKLQRIEEKRDKRQREFDEELEKLHRKHGANNKNKEEKALRKILWLLIRRRDGTLPPPIYPDLEEGDSKV